MNPTIIFEEEDRHKTKRYKIKGCEKAIIVRSDTAAFILQVETMSLNDAHYRPQNLLNIVSPGDYPIDMLPIGCGMELIFRIEEPLDPNSHLFVEIQYETCIPEKCCPCGK
jgi:hypothetical protein